MLTINHSKRTIFGYSICKVLQLLSVITVTQAFLECHDDPTFEPDPGLLKVLQFTWLGTLQYIHVKKGTPHYFRVPRVVLISGQFVLSTAIDAAQVPHGYALGNVIFGDYERDEVECHVSTEQIAVGAACEPALLLMPVADVLLHPEYKHFHVRHSIALLKLITPVKSKYMVPVCIPYKDYTRMGREDTNRPENFYHIDFTSAVPRDFAEEEKEIIILNMLPKEMCFLYDEREGDNATTDIRLGCSSGCGLHSGAPTVIHEHTGHWTVISLAQGGASCPDPLRPRRAPPPPAHTLLFPYVTWITSAITGRSYNEFAKFDPFGYVMPRTRITEDRRSKGWIGKWWMGGIRCYDRGEAADSLFRFYHEMFLVQPVMETSITYYIEIEAPPSVTVVCIKVGVPYRLGNPTVWDLDTSSVKIRIMLQKFYMRYMFEVEAWGYNKTAEVFEEE